MTNEIRSRWNSYSEISSASALQLTYLQAVINEALRIHPSGANGFPRISPGATVDGHWVPAGVRYYSILFSGHVKRFVSNAMQKQTEIFTSTWTVSHDERYFADPDAFIPERWVDPNCKDTKEASQPFSLGYRACIGRRYGEPGEIPELYTCCVSSYGIY